MDNIRESDLAGPINDDPARSAAYRIMHLLASKDLLAGNSVILGATYQPPQHRAELANLALRLDVPLYVVQCVCPPDIAAWRFEHRTGKHAGTDLTTLRVKQLVERYERFDGAMLLETPKESDPIEAVNTYLAARVPVDPVRWACHKYFASEMVRDLGKPTALLPKLSESSVRAAKRRRRYYAGGWVLLCVSVTLGLTPILYKIVGRIQIEYSSKRATAGAISAAMHGLFALITHSWRSIAPLTFSNVITWAAFCFAFAGFGSIVLGLVRDTREHRAEAKQVVTAGDSPRYSLTPGEILPSDTEIYHAYMCRSSKDQAFRIPIANVPICFLIPPQQGRSFAAIVRSSEDRPCILSDDAKRLGMDWSGFTAWRQKSRREEYSITFSHEYGLRAVGLDDQTHKGTYLIEGVKCSYDEYVTKELAVNLCAPGTLPDMRRLLEGPEWDSGNLDLLSVANSAKRYSMRLSITGLVLTHDDYFILQRRSSVVGHGLGSLAAAVNGAADHYADCSDEGSWAWSILGKLYANLPYACHSFISKFELEGPQCWNLAKSALRELHEEIGLGTEALHEKPLSGVPCLEQPFIAAAYNLRYGRDLNFYCCFRTRLNSQDISAQRDYARDKWEVENLVFLHRDKVTAQAIISGSLDKVLPNRARHLLGALYAWAIFAKQD